MQRRKLSAVFAAFVHSFGATIGRFGPKTTKSRVSSKHPVKPVVFIEPNKSNRRQQRRCAARKNFFIAINKKHGPEPRRIRRAIAFTIARREWRIEP